jgi:hypothetical protein
MAASSGSGAASHQDSAQATEANAANDIKGARRGL